MDAPWNSRFPPEFVDFNRRLKPLEYLFEPDGTPSRALRDAIDQLQDGEGADFMKKILPHTVMFEWNDPENDTSRIPYDWFREHLTGCWNIFGKGKIYFENWEDAFAFRMVFC